MATVLDAADGQSVDGSGSLQLPLLLLKAGLRAAACNGRARAGSDTARTIVEQ